MNDLQVLMLASGSKGNAALISSSRQRFLVDIGISCRELTKRMKEISVSPEELDGVFITHEHVDHVRGLETFLKKYQVPVYSSMHTWRAILGKYTAMERKNCRLIEGGLLCGDMRKKALRYRMMRLIRTATALRARPAAPNAPILLMPALSRTRYVKPCLAAIRWCWRPIMMSRC